MFRIGLSILSVLVTIGVECATYYPRSYADSSYPSSTMSNLNENFPYGKSVSYGSDITNFPEATRYPNYSPSYGYSSYSTPGYNTGLSSTRYPGYNSGYSTNSYNSLYGSGLNNQGYNNYGAGSYGSSSYGSGSLGTGNYGSGSYGTGNYGSGSLGTGNYGSGSLGTGNYGSGSLGTGNYGSGSLGTGNYGPGSLGTGNYGSGSLGTGTYGSGSYGSGSGTGNYGSGSYGTGNYGTSSYGTGRGYASGYSNYGSGSTLGGSLGGYTSSYEAPFMGNQGCVNRGPQNGIHVDSLMGMWYGVEYLQHLGADSHYDAHNYNTRTCIVIHIAEPVERPSTEHQPYHQQAINAKFRQQYRHLRLLWDEAGQTTEYSLYFRNDTAGYWQVFDRQNGTLAARDSYHHFSGTVQVLKAVNDHLVLNFCQEGSNMRSPQLYSVLFSRKPGEMNRWEIEAVHNMLQNKKLSVASRRMVCGNNGAERVAYSMIFSILTWALAYIVGSS